MSEDQDLPARPALSGRRERARLLGEDGPPAWDGDGTGQAVPGDRPPAVPQGPLRPASCPGASPAARPAAARPRPRSVPPNRFASPARPATCPAAARSSRRPRAAKPQARRTAGPCPPAPPAQARRLPDLKPASDSSAGAFQPTGGPGRRARAPAGTVLGGDPQPGVRPAGLPSPSRMTSPAAPSCPAHPSRRPPTGRQAHQPSPARRSGPQVVTVGPCSACGGG